MAKIIKTATDSPHVKGNMTAQPVIPGVPDATIVMGATNNTRGRINKKPVGLPIKTAGGRS